MPGNAPVQTSSLFWTGTGAVTTNFNFTNVTTASSATAGSETVLAEYQVPFGTQLRFDGGRGIQAYLEATAGVQLVTGTLIMCVTRQDGSRKIIMRTPLAAFGSSNEQKDVNFQQSYQATTYAYGGLGEVFQVIHVSGGVAFDGTLTDTRMDLPYNYRITGR